MRVIDLVISVHRWAPRLVVGCALSLGLVACEDGEAGEAQETTGNESSCGPSEATVARVIDGDTIELSSGEKVRYLMIDTPESTTEQECWGPEAKAANAALVEDQTITLTYDEECTDIYDRLLAYVSVGGQEVNRLLVEQGHACVLYIPPNGEDRVEEFEALEDFAKGQGSGLWSCDPQPCG